MPILPIYIENEVLRLQRNKERTAAGLSSETLRKASHSVRDGASSSDDMEDWMNVGALLGSLLTRL